MIQGHLSEIRTALPSTELNAGNGQGGHYDPQCKDKRVVPFRQKTVTISAPPGHLSGIAIPAVGEGTTRSLTQAQALKFGDIERQAFMPARSYNEPTQIEHRYNCHVRKR